MCCTVSYQIQESMKYSKRLRADYATGNYSDGFTNKMSRVIIFDNETQAQEWWGSKLLCEPLFKIKEI